MKVILSKPFGYCYGVMQAMSIASSAKKAHPNEDVYLLGAPVHNEEAIERLKEEGLILIDGDFTSLEKSLLALKRGSVVVFSAHGHPASFDEIARSKEFEVHDGTCAFVRENIKAGLSSLKPVIYIGESRHSEKEAFLANCKGAYFIDAISLEGDCASCPSAPLLIAQTTLSLLEMERAVRKIKEIYPDAEIAKERCSSTRIRQERVAELSKKVDCAIVLGSKTSANSRNLLAIASLNCPSFLCLNEKEVASLDLSSYRSALVCSGASTEASTVDKTVSYLSSL